jgi:hypothetical protein
MEKTLHKEDVVQTQTQEWTAPLTRLLQEEQGLYRELRESARGLRRALIQGLTAEIGAEVARHQDLLARLRGVQQRAAELSHAAALVPPGEEPSLARLARAPRVQESPEAAAEARAAEAEARETARELAHNRQLIARLSDWMAREIRILLEPLQQTGGYGPQGAAAPSAAEPALVDRRG